MYLDNEKISQRLMKRLIVFNIFSLSALIIPRIAVASAGRDGIISILIGLLLAFLYILFIGFISKNTSGNFMRYSKEKCGNVISFIIGVFYIVKYFACLVLCCRLFARVIKETLLEDADVRFIIIMLLILSAYSASKGFEVRARITELLYFIVLIPIVLFLIMGLKSIDMANLLPLFIAPKNDIIYGGYGVFITFTTLEFMMFSMHYIQDQPLKSNPEGKLNNQQEKTFKFFRNNNLNYILNGFIIVGIIILLLFVTTVGILGPVETSKKLWSSINMIQIVGLPGGFLQRHDALIISIWMLSIFTLTSGFLYYLLMISKEILHLKSQNHSILPYLVLLYIACTLPLDIEVYFWYFEKFMMIIAIPLSIILPLFVVIVGTLRDYFDRIKENKSNKINIKDYRSKAKSSKGKNLMLLFVLPAFLSITACSDMTEVEDRTFIQSIGIDYTEEEISLSLESPDLAAYTDQGSSDEEAKEKLITTIKGNDFYEIEEEHLNESNKRLDFSHLQVIIFGRSLLENKDVYGEFLYYLENKYEISKNTLIVISDSSAEDIMKINSKLDIGIGNFLHQLYNINVINKGREEIKLQNLLLSNNEDNYVAKLPIIAIEDEKILVNGVGFIKEGVLAYETDLHQNEYINIARGFGDNSRLFIEDKSENIKYVLKINNIKQKIKFKEKNNKPFLILQIEGDCDLEKGLEVSQNGFDISEKEVIKEINLQTNQYIHDQILKLIEEITKRENVDFLNLYRETYKNMKVWLKYEGKQDEFLDDLGYLIEVDIDL